jgi:hypothetical protein
VALDDDEAGGDGIERIPQPVVVARTRSLTFSRVMNALITAGGRSRVSGCLA